MHVPEPPVGGDVALLDGDGEVGLDGDAEGRGEWPVLWLADGAGLARTAAEGFDFAATFFDFATALAMTEMIRWSDDD